MSPKLSVITAVRNGRSFIESCLRCVIDQNCPLTEHVIIDGASTDGTPDVIRAYAEKYGHIHWLSQPDQGQSEALNRGLQLANGDFISILNVDDYYSEGALNFAIATLEALPEPSFLVGNCTVWHNDGGVWVNRPRFSGLYDLVLPGNAHLIPVNPSQYFYHKMLHSLVGDFDIDREYTMDMDFVFRAVQRSNVFYVDRNLGNFRLHSSTKTYRDIKSGNASQRYNRLCRRYARTLPWTCRGHYELHVLLGKLLNSVRIGLRFIKYL